MKKYVLMNEWPVTVLVSLFKDAALKLMGQTNRALFHPLFHIPRVPFMYRSDRGSHL